MNIDDEDNLPIDDEPEAGDAGDEGDEQGEPSGPDDETEESEEGAEGEDPDGQPEDDDEDVEYQGKKFRAPKGVKDSLMMHSDYTKKTQTVAEERKQVKALAQKVEADFNARVAMIEDLAEAKSLEKQIALFKGLNWDAIQAKDMGEYLRLQRQQQAAETSLRDLNAKITQTQHEQSLQQQQETAKQLQEGLRVLKGKFPDWTPQTFVDLGNFGVSLGFSEEEVAAIADPRYMEVLHLAKIGRQFLDGQKRQKPSKTAQNPQQPAPKPVPKVTSARPAPGQLNDKMSDAEWMKRRNEQVHRRG